jgi:hypothetical protein
VVEKAMVPINGERGRNDGGKREKRQGKGAMEEGRKKKGAKEEGWTEGPGNILHTRQILFSF